MHIYSQEIKDGIGELIKSSASFSYASVVQPGISDDNKNLINFKSLASYSDSDLYYVHSILVSSSWNKNDDIFDRAEVWLARNTPEDKPTNLNHDEGLIVGHITANWPITVDGILIDENTPLENLPEKYHILTGSVIYKGFTDPDLRERTGTLIAEIENGQKYVSMECFFKGFDYGLINKETQQYKILARNESTAYLSKYLRAYGGLGEHDNYQIGRVLRQITFTGKGFVDKPANPDSVIFTYQNFQTNLEEKSDKKSESGVSNFQSNLKVENITMSSEQEIQTETVATETTVAETQITELQTTLAETQAALETIKVEKEEAAKKMDEEMKKKQEELMKMKAEIDAANEVIAAYKDKEMQMMKKEKKMKRMAALVEAGVEGAEAEATADKFESLEDDAFDAITNLLAAKKAKMDKMEKMTKEVKASDNADTSVLDNAEVNENEVDLSVGGEAEESAVESTRAALVEFVCARLGKKLNKGE